MRTYLDGGWIEYHPKSWVSPEWMMQRLLDELTLIQGEISLFGKTHPVPRLTSWHGDLSYTYSGQHNPAKGWTLGLYELLVFVNRQYSSSDWRGWRFNSVLANYYRLRR